MNTTLTQFIAYLEALATAHIAVAHNAETHPAFIRFYEAKDPEKAARNQIENVPCVMVKDYDFRFVDNKSDNLHKMREIEFLILDKIGRSSSSNDVYDIWESVEEIGDEFIVRMKADKAARRNTAVINFDLNQVKGVPVDLTSGGLYGISYTVPVSSIRTNDPDTDKWSDL